MHNPFYNTTSSLIQIEHFNETSNATTTNIIQNKLSDTIINKIESRERFYGIEILARSINCHNSILNYNLFKIQPLFTSIVWIGELYADFEPFKETPALQCMNMVKQGSIVMPHLTCYRMTEDKIHRVLQDDILNVLALQGDKVYENQKFKHAIDLVREIRNLKKNNISIGVGGYPEGHSMSDSLEEDLSYLKQKVDAGADFIITQICFLETSIQKFIKNCRQKGITIPIILGIFVPDNFNSLIKMNEITKVKVPSDLFKKYYELKDDRELFKQFAEQNAFQMIKNLFDSNLEIYGVQFFTLNYFDSIYRIVNKLF